MGTLVEDYDTEEGHQTLVEALRGMVLVKDSATLASEIARRARIERSPAGRVLIEEGGSDSEIYFILEGRLQVMVRGREYALLGPGAHVGEFSLIDPTALRSATVRSLEETVTARLSETDFAEIAVSHPTLWRRVSATLGSHLREGNRFLRRPNPRPRVLVCASPVGVLFAQAIRAQARDTASQVPDWLVEAQCPVQEGNFDRLEEAFRGADLGVIVLAPGEFDCPPENEAPSGRDALFLCCGISVGALGNARTVIVQPEDLGDASPAAALGLTPLTYRLDPPEAIREDVQSICRDLRARIQTAGAR